MESNWKILDQLNNLNLDINLRGKFLDNNYEDIIIVCKGYIDAYNSEEFKSAIKNIIDQLNPKIILLDLNSVNYIASAGVGSLIEILSITKEKEINFKIYNANFKIKDIISMMGFSNLFIFLDDELEDYRVEKPTIFPLKIKCYHCSVFLKLPKAGKFVCKYCKSEIRVNDRGDFIR